MFSKSEIKFQRQYDDASPNFAKLSTTAFTLLQHAVNTKDIKVLSIQHRVKNKDSATQKLRRKKYENPIADMTDLVGLRVIVFLEDDIDRVDASLREILHIDEIQSVDKRSGVSINHVGYRSLHLVATLGESRQNMPEYAGICGQKFEVQIRTALQHAWAEIEHSQNYKGAHSLPDDLQRRLMVLSGTLELIDREFASIVSEARQYGDTLTFETDKPSNEGISKIAINRIMAREVSKAHKNFPLEIRENTMDEIIEELKGFGIEKVSDFENLIARQDSQSLIQRIPADSDLTTTGLARLLMMINDLDQYLNESFDNSFNNATPELIYFLEDKYGTDEIEKMLDTHDIEII